MPTLLIAEPVAPPSTKETALTRCLGAYLPWALLGAYLALMLPLFLREAPHSDVTMWDICTRTVLRGGVFYRDTDENNFPGMLWPLLAVRSTLGWSSEALRFVDFGFVSAIIWLLTLWLPPGYSSRARAGTMFILYAFYLSTSEWCHCQRDMWMLLPALAALHLRYRQVQRVVDPHAPRIILGGWAFAEGVLWASGFWIKPFVAVPCLACWFLSLWLTRGTGRPWGRVLADGFGVLGGGLCAGALGIAWLVYSGAWPWFLEVMFVWNREYATFDATEGLGWMYFAGFIVRFFPWVLIHAAAVPVAFLQIWGMRGRPTEARPRISATLLAGFYLAWLFQTVVLQHLFDYVHAPAILLGLALVVVRCFDENLRVARWSLVAFVGIALFVNYPAVYGRRLGAWKDCFRDGSTPQLRDRLTLNPTMNWSALDQVRAFLATQNLQDGELTCFSMRTSPLYLQMDLQPSTRHVFVQNALTIFTSQRGRMHALLAGSRQRFVVFDLFAMRLPTGEAAGADPETMPLPSMWQPPSRWAGKVVFRAGRYVVFAVDAADMPAWLDESFHL